MSRHVVAVDLAFESGRAVLAGVSYGSRNATPVRTPAHRVIDPVPALDTSGSRARREPR